MGGRGNGEPCGACGGRGRWTWGGSAVHCGARGERERWWQGLGVGVLYGRRGEEEVDMGRRWRSWWRLREWERRERGPGGSWWDPGGAGAARVGG